MGNKTNMELLCEITEETDLIIKRNKETGTISFTYSVYGDGDIKQFIRPLDLKEHENDTDMLLKYVLEEIYSTILGAKEINR